MDAAIECNNMGVELLHTGRLDEALDTFKGAARILYPVSQCFQHPTTPNSAGICSSPLQAAAPQVFLDKTETIERAKAELSIANLSSRGTSRLDENSFVFARPLNVERLQEEPTSCTMESAIIVYNMGLAYHLYGTVSCVQKALCLFDMAFSLAFSVSLDRRSPKIVMASLNNAGEIHHSLGNYQLSRQYLDSLYSYILSLPSAKDEESLKERHQLLLNAMLLQEPRIAGAA